MANFFEGIEGILKHPINEAKWMWDETKNVGKPLLKGDIGKSWGAFKDSFGNHQDMMSDTITTPLGGHNKLTENSDAVAGAIIGSIFAAPLMAGGSAGAGGGAGGSTAAGTSGGGFGSGGAFSGYFQPSNLSNVGLSSQGVGWSPGQATAGMNFGSTAYTPTTQFGGASGASAGSGFNLQEFGRILQSVQQPEEQRVPTGGGSAGGRGFSFDSKLYQNPMLEREYNSLYTSPMYTPLVK
ncbi:hypothetical protein APT65_00023 [Trabzonvirus APT65]|uniref:Uncharacterized protein n=1 Tax=Aeromonas phage APT65 TaxID=2982914 RepID=A0A9E8GAN2_9CAUD|nr:hypothetical protein APT65_00023 [Aeromonas phage APT65]